MPLLISDMSTNETACLDGVIGLANCACPCLVASAPAGWNDSGSKLFLNTLIPLNMADAGADCTDLSNPWSVLSRGRDMGYLMFLNDFRSRLGKRAKPKRDRVKNARIGEESATAVLPIQSTYAGVHIPTAFIRGAYLIIKSIGGVFDAVGATTVNIYDNNSNVVAGPFVITTTVAGKWAETPVSASLPLWRDNGQDQNYWIAYTVNQASLPRAVRIWCPCNGVPLPVYTMDNPYWRTNDTRNAWTNWVMVGAWEGNTLDFDPEQSVTSSLGYTNGLTLQIELNCDSAGVICQDGIDYSDPGAMSAAFAAYYAGGICSGELIASNIEPFRESGVTSDFLKEALPAWRQRYEENLEYAVYQADLTQSDCVICKPALSFSIQGKTP